MGAEIHVWCEKEKAQSELSSEKVSKENKESAARTTELQNHKFYE